MKTRGSEVFGGENDPGEQQIKSRLLEAAGFSFQGLRDFLESNRELSSFEHELALEGD